MLLVSLAAPATLTQLLTTAWVLPTGWSSTYSYFNMHHHLQIGCPSERTSYGHFSHTPPASKDAGHQQFCAIKKRNKAPAKAMLAQITIMTYCYFLGKIFENVQWRPLLS